MTSHNENTLSLAFMPGTGCTILVTMAVYKVPQDVEAEDKLLGPLTFKQFIFLMIAAGGSLFAWALYSIQPPLALLPVPVILVFGGLAVVHREDQPIERYLLSFFNFMLRPRTRIWSTEGGYEHLIITAPKTAASPELKRNVGEVHDRLEEIAQIVDSRGWAVKRPGGVNGSVAPPPVDDRLDVPPEPAEPQEIHDREDIMDESNPDVVQIDTLLQEQAQQQRQELLKRVQDQVENTEPQGEMPKYDPYGAGMSHQHRINPDGSGNIEPGQVSDVDEKATPEETITAPAKSYGESDILSLSDELTVSQIADKVKRESDRHLQEGEEIKLR